MTYGLRAGDTLCLDVSFYSSTTSGTVSITMEKIDVRIKTYPVTLWVGETADTAVSVTPNFLFKEWMSENPDIATVDAYGRVTAISVGETRIFCRLHARNASTSTNDYPYIGKMDYFTLNVI